MAKKMSLLLVQQVVIFTTSTPTSETIPSTMLLHLLQRKFPTSMGENIQPN